MSALRRVLGYGVLLLTLVLARSCAPTFELGSVVSTALVLLTVVFLGVSASRREGPRAVRTVLGWAVLLVITWVAWTRHLAAGPAWELAYGRGVVGLLIASYLVAFAGTLDVRAVRNRLKAALAYVDALLECAAIFFIVGGLGFCALEYLRQQLGSDEGSTGALVGGAFLLTVLAPVRSVTKVAALVTLAGTFVYWVYH